MSSACTSVSPSQLSGGPGGPLEASTTARKRSSVAAGPPALIATISFAVIRSNRNPDEASLPTKASGVPPAVATMCARVSSTVRPSHSDGADHCSAVRGARSSASARRSACTTGQMSSATVASARRAEHILLLARAAGQPSLVGSIGSLSVDRAGRGSAARLAGSPGRGLLPVQAFSRESGPQGTGGGGGQHGLHLHHRGGELLFGRDVLGHPAGVLREGGLAEHLQHGVPDGRRRGAAGEPQPGAGGHHPSGVVALVPAVWEADHRHAGGRLSLNGPFTATRPVWA